MREIKELFINRYIIEKRKIKLLYLKEKSIYIKFLKILKYLCEERKLGEILEQIN